MGDHSVTGWWSEVWDRQEVWDQQEVWGVKRTTLVIGPLLGQETEIR